MCRRVKQIGCGGEEDKLAKTEKEVISRCNLERKKMRDLSLPVYEISMKIIIGRETGCKWSNQ